MKPGRQAVTTAAVTMAAWTGVGLDRGLGAARYECVPRRGMRCVMLVVALWLAGAVSASAAAAPALPAGAVKTLCVGRFLLDVPAASTVSAQYVYARRNINTYQGVSSAAFRQRVAAREKALGNAPHRDGGSMLVGVLHIDDDAALVSSWSADGSRLGHRQELYVHDPVHEVLFVTSGDTDATRLAAAMDNHRSLRSRVFHRAADALPTTAGFCIDSGFIAGNRINSEEMNVGVRLGDRPGTTLNLMSRVVGTLEPRLLQRVPTAPGQARYLRRAAHSVDGLAGDELLAVTASGGGRRYAFLWESQGRPESLRQPFLSLQLLGEDPPAGPPVFAGDAQAISAWELLLRGLRLRPGAI